MTSYARAMSAGKWMETGQPIIVSSQGVLIDGQHRLEAIIRSGVNLRMLKVTVDALDERGELTARQVPIDIGYTRSISNITGLIREHVAVIKIMLRMFEAGGSPLATDPSVIMDRYEKLSMYLDKINLSHKKYYSSASILATLVVADYRGTDMWEQYSYVVSRQYEKITPAWASWMRIMEKASKQSSFDAERMKIAATWVLSKTKSTRIVIRDIEKEVAECASVYQKMIDERIR